MRALMRYPSFYFALPIIIACFLTLITFDLPHDYFMGLFLLMIIAVSIIGLDFVLKIRLPEAAIFQTADFSGSREAFTATVFCGIVILFCILDITLFPIPLIVDPSIYATFDGGRDHIRHISSMSWILAPIGLLCVKNKLMRYSFISISFIFPVLVLDRNRLLAALFSFLVIFIFRRKNTIVFPWKSVLFLGITGAIGFSVLGIVRSGNLEYITLPFSRLFIESPVSLKWLFLYISAGVYNFSAILSKGYENSEYLLTQIVPFYGSLVTVATDIPFDAPTINVGTEFFPFLIAFGSLGVIFSAGCLYAMLVWSVFLLKKWFSLFSILIFLRLAYVCFMSPFAPQAFTWTNIGFLLICIFLFVFATLLPKRKIFR